ncbi:Discoidin, CUB and LCCL domain-containing protein 1 [Varanus komodoensis]|nr:Discoidin, CUB and LCCL domain-containing protein 1 [Varanus komodoensis]
MEVVTDFIFLGPKITADGDCSQEIKRHLILGRRAMANLDSILKSRDITLPTKVHIVKAMVFPVAMYGCESWTIRKAEHQRIEAFELWCWRRLLRVPWTTRRSNRSVPEEINPDCSLEGQILKMKLKHFGHLMRRKDSLEKSLMLGTMDGKRRRGQQRMRWLDGVTGAVGDGCGHSVLTPSSGSLTSKNYPGTYPNFTSCEWKIQGAAGSHLSLAFGDMDIEASEGCKLGFLLLSSPPDGSSFGPYCGYSNPPHSVLVMNSSSVTVLFNSTTHRSGRGFLLSYASGNQPGSRSRSFHQVVGSKPPAEKPNSLSLANENIPITFSFSPKECPFASRKTADGAATTQTQRDRDVCHWSQCDDDDSLMVSRGRAIAQWGSTCLLGRSSQAYLQNGPENPLPETPELLPKGIHYDKQLIRAYCPAGCKGVTGDLWGNADQGYRDTSVLCKAAVHAGVISDEQGGEITVSREKGITLYESVFANGLHSKRGSLSEKRLIFHRACAGALEVASFSASSHWHEQNILGEKEAWTADQASFRAGSTSWAAGQSSADQWLEIDLGGRRNITGIITKGSSQKHNYYVKSYQVLFSRDGKKWKTYKSKRGNEDKLFEGNSNSFQEVSNAFIPPILARYLRISPQTWNQRAALKVALLGCQAPRLKIPRPYSNGGSQPSGGLPGFMDARSCTAVGTPPPGEVAFPNVAWTEVGMPHRSVEEQLCFMQKS